MSAKHTPGPWTHGWENDSREWAIVTNAAGQIIANVNTESGPDMAPLVSDKMPTDANARLIAAAPELLEALEVVNVHLQIHRGVDADRISAQVRAAIAKARWVVA